MACPPLSIKLAVSPAIVSTNPSLLPTPSNLTAQHIEREMKNYDSTIEKPPNTVSIIVVAYNEEQFIEQCVNSLLEQEIILHYPKLFELIFVNTSSTDNTLKIVKRTLSKSLPITSKIFTTAKGKLTGRNVGTDNARGNIIISVDGDAYYPPYWLNTLLKPFQNPDVIAVSGSTFDYSVPNMSGEMYSMIGYFQRLTNPTRMAGINCAYYKNAFYKIGKFDEMINQMDVNAMLQEEEYGFGQKLSEYGSVLFKLNASCVHYGGFKMGCRTNPGDPKNKEICAKYKFGIERFGN